MKNKKIRTNRKEISDNEILKHKNFDNVINSINTQPTSMFQGLRFWGITGSTAIIITALIIGLSYFDKDNNENEILADEVSESFINPPIAEADIPYELHTINNSKDTTIQSETGSLIFIPADAFKDEKNNDLKDDIVKIKYREFHSPYDIFVSGIPMDYDSAGTDFTFESAGMLEFLAYQDAKPIDLKNGKELVIDMISDNDNRDFNLYKFDKETGIWDYKGKDIVNPVNEIAAENDNREITDDFETEIFVKPIKPILQDKQKYSFEVESNEQIGNLVDVNNVLFEIDESKCEFDPVYFSTSWEKIKLNKIDDSNFEISLSKNDKTVNLIAYPVYNSENYKQAISKYNNIVDANTKQKVEVLSKRKSEINDKSNITDFNEGVITRNLKTWSFRRLVVPSVGLWNCDKPQLPPGKIIEASFVNELNEEVGNKEIYVVERDKNQLNRFPGTMPSISVNTKVDNIMWTLTDENKIGIVNRESINDVVRKGSGKQKTFEIVEYDNLEGCKKVKELIEGKTEGKVVEKKKVKTRTYPNPFTNYVTVDLSEKHECIVQLLNVNGQMVDNVKFYGNKYEWKLNKYKTGNYVVVVLIPSINYKETFKIIKK